MSEKNSYSSYFASPVAALMYDFDKTLSPKDMQEYGFIDGVGMTANDFWHKCNSTAKEKRMDPILSYMLIMLEESRGKMLLTRSLFNNLGRDVQLFPGVETWFSRVNSYGAKRGLSIEHYIISSGLREIIEGTKIAHEFKQIFAAEYCYDDKDVPIWPARAVNYTSKTQFPYRINKGVLDVTDHDGLNEFTPEEHRRVPFRNMIYIGDGLTDVPCMKLVRENGGHSIALYQNDSSLASELLNQNRVDFTAVADYSPDSVMENTVFEILDIVAAKTKAAQRHLECMAEK